MCENEQKKDLNSAPNLVYDEVILNHRQRHKMKANPLALNLILVFQVVVCFYLMWFFRLPAPASISHPIVTWPSSSNSYWIRHSVFGSGLCAVFALTEGQHQKVTEIDPRWSEIRLFSIYYFYLRNLNNKNFEQSVDQSNRV